MSSRRTAGWCAVALLAVGAGCSTQAPLASPGAIFVDIAAEAGVDYVNFNGMTGRRYLVEITGPGVALFDYDNDGDLDLYLVQGGMLGDHPISEAIFPPPEPLPLSDQLYRNDLTIEPDGSRTVHFTNVTKQAGIVAEGYGQGVAAGDYDGDGWIDLYLANFGADELWRNQGDGTFKNVTGEAGIDNPPMSSSVIFVDYDGDSDLDLFVANYVRLPMEDYPHCRGRKGNVDYCDPNTFQPLADTLYRNDGDGSFADVTTESGIGFKRGAALGLVAADFNGDGRQDVYVANDGMANYLWINRGDGTFVDEALLRGCAFNNDGTPEASMGVDLADLDGDGLEDLILTHLDGETNTLYRNNGDGMFTDDTSSAGLAAASMPYTGFGTAFLDYDNDGWLDLYVANGAVHISEEQMNNGDPLPLKQKNQLYRNVQGRLEDVSGEAGPVFDLNEVSRGVAFGDIDNDGDTDLVVTNVAGPVRVLENRIGSRQPWLGVKLRGAPGEVAGAVVEAVTSEGEVLKRRPRPWVGYLSSNDPRVLFGLAGRGSLKMIRVSWPDRTQEEWTDLTLNQYHELKKGGGRPVVSMETER